MPLPNHHESGNKISNKLGHCPNCGYKLPNTIEKTVYKTDIEMLTASILYLIRVAFISGIGIVIVNLILGPYYGLQDFLILFGIVHIFEMVFEKDRFEKAYGRKKIIYTQSS